MASPTVVSTEGCNIRSDDGDISFHNTVGSTVTTKSYNITIFMGSTTETQAALEKQWDAIIDNVTAVVEGKTLDEDDSNIRNEEPASQAEPPAQRRLTIYTSVDNANKKLKRSTDVVLTLTPSVSDPQKQWATIVWKVLHFEKTTTMNVPVIWSNEAGFCVLREDDDGTLVPGDLTMVVQPGHVAILKDVAGSHNFEDVIKMPSAPGGIAFANTTTHPQRFALCTIDPLKPESDKFSPVVDLGPFQNLEGHDVFQCEPPVLLQAYAVPPGFRERQPFDTSKLQRPLLTTPINVSKLEKNTIFRLYSNNAGKVVLE